MIRFQVRRRTTGAAGAPASLLSGEIAYNQMDGKIYIGFGDDGAGNATSIKSIAKDDFVANIPTGGINGKILGFTGGVPAWIDAPQGAVYTASGDGIELTGSQFTLNYAEIATGISLSNYATTASLTSGLAGKVDKAGDTLTGKLTLVATAAGAASLNLPHGTAPTAPGNGDTWTTTGGLFVRVNGATKTVAFTDSSITGSAATLTTARNIGIGGGGITGTGVAFNGSANITISASVDNGHITLARMANLAANSIIGNNTAGAAAPLALTGAQVKAMLGLVKADVGLDQVDNTSDAAKPISTATQTALDGKANVTHTHDAADITTGVFDVARIPVLPSQKTITSSGSIANLSAPQQADIVEGTTVTTTDGRRWVYTGIGSKTAEASYIELADVTPEWTVIANKPSFATVATSGSYADLTGKPALATVATSGSYTDLLNKPTLATVATTGNYTDLTNKPTLGTIATQNANAVAITGGTIDGIILDGGTF